MSQKSDVLNENIENGRCFNNVEIGDQVCIIGSGPAGITAAWELSQRGVGVILLEGSREFDYSEYDYFKKSWLDKMQLYNGKAAGIFADNEPQFLIRPYPNDVPPHHPDNTNPSERERVYGGTSTHWGGQCRPLDPVVFDKRRGAKDQPGFPGWPITRKHLDPFYAKASKLNHLVGDYGESGDNFKDTFWVEQMCNFERSAEQPELKHFDNEIYQFMSDDWTNFATRTFDGQQIAETSVRVIVNATVLEIVEQGGSIDHLNVASMKKVGEKPDGRPILQKDTEFTVKAETYILACGAVANARQLLLSELGGDYVGKYFMCHPFTNQHPAIRTLLPDYLNQAQRNLMGFWKYPTGQIDFTEGRFILDGQTATDEGIGRAWFRDGGSYAMYMEMAPNPESRVTLRDEPDPVFGQKQTHINWELSPLDETTYQRNCELFAESSPKYPKDPIISWDEFKDLAGYWVVNGHHLGTTRMSPTNEPTDGVVDKNLKVFGVDNLYVAGSSVFPTAGLSNPTMTIITLSIRLGEHVAGFFD